MRPAPPPPRLLRQALRHGRGPAAVVLVCSAAGAAAAVAFPLALARALDALLAGEGTGRWAALCALLVAAEVTLDATAAWAGGAGNARTTAWLRRLTADRFLGAADDRPGGLATRLTVNSLDAGTAPVATAAALASVLVPLGGLAGLFLLDPWAGAAFLAGLPPLLLILRVSVRDGAGALHAYQEAQGQVAGRLAETLAGARTIAAAGTEERERARVLAPLAALLAAGRRTWRVQGRAAGGAGLLMPLLTAGVLAVAGLRLSGGHLTAGELLAVARYTVLAAGAGAVVGALNGWLRARAAVARLAAVTDARQTAYGTAAPPPGGNGTLELRGVRVVRDGEALLDGVDLLLPGGTTAAVVGPSGAGKSLLAAVAGRLTDPDAGTVLLDGLDLRALDAAALRREVTYAFARPVLLGATVGAAIGSGAWPPPDGAVRAAALAAGADPFVRRLPQGYDTPLRDAPLSGGERQRLGLARAFAHTGRLLILDDATSSLDTVTERLVTRALTESVRPCTRLVVAHRVAVAARADVVVWLEAGRVRAVAPHARLWRETAYRAVFAVGGGEARA
ncbi:ATP-binding cassette domain-containing protein [Streptomyces avicenniae]|uniref:ATP-binding cassette domain-containing protein n=1 Tax=Streptomyces avicenniae TaxID=500153 RepID=UPI000699BA91|nr:ABC transporter ATP-binding protein [Streptomyces avicenniae]